MFPVHVLHTPASIDSKTRLALTPNTIISRDVEGSRLVWTIGLDFSGTLHRGDVEGGEFRLRNLRCAIRNKSHLKTSFDYINTYKQTDGIHIYVHILLDRLLYVYTCIRTSGNISFLKVKDHTCSQSGPLLLR